MRSVIIALAIPACWTGSPAVQPVVRVTPHRIAPTDATLDRDLERLGAYLAHTGEPFTAVELVGFTATHGIVYRTAVCDPDELGGRGPYCTIAVCTDATCETIVDDTVDEPSGTFDPDRASAEIRAAEIARHPTSRGKTEALSAVSIAADGGDLSLSAPAFGLTSWTVLEASTDPDTNQRYGFTRGAISSVLTSPDGACIAAGGATLRLGRYESVVGSIRVGFASRRCR